MERWYCVGSRGRTGNGISISLSRAGGGVRGRDMALHASAEGRRKVIKEERMRLSGSEVSLAECWCLGQLC